MRKAILDTISQSAIGRRGLIFAVWGALSLASVAVLATSGLHIDTSRQAMVSEDNVHSRRYQEFLREFGTPLHLVVVVEGNDPAANRAYADALAAELAEQPDLVGDVLYKVDYDVMRDYALLYAPKGELEQLRDRLRTATEAMGLTAKSDEAVTFGGLTGSLAKANEVLSSLEEGDTEGWTRAEKLGGRAGELDAATGAVFRVLQEALTTEGWTELALAQSVGSADVSAAGVDPQGYLSAGDGRVQFLFVQPASPSEQVSFLVPMVEAVRATAERLRPEGVTVGLTGSPAFVVEEMAQIQHDMVLTSAVSLVAVLALFLLAYRSITAGALVFVPLLAGVLLTLAIVSVTIGRLNLMSSMFLAILVGLGVDFGIHLLARFDEELGRGRPLADAIHGTLIGAGPGVVTGALTTVAAFGAMTLSDFTAMRELGVIAGLGVMLVLVATLTLLPSLLAARYVRGARPTHAAAARKRTRTGLVARLVGRPWPTLIVALLVTVGLASSIKPIEFNFDIKQFLPANSPAMAALEKLEQSDFYNPDFAIMVASSLKEARAWTRELEQRGDVVARVESLATYLPADQGSKAEILKEVKDLARRFPRLVLEAEGQASGAAFRKELAQLVEYLEVDVPLTLEMHGMGAYKEGAATLAQKARGTLEAVADMPDAVLSARLLNLERRLGGLIEGVQRFVRSDRLSVQPKDLPDDLLNQYYRESDGRERFVVRVFPKGSIADPVFMGKFKETLTALYPETTGYPITFLEFGYLLREGLERSALWALIAIVMLLLADFRSVRHTLASLFPLALGAVWMLAGMNLFGIGYNFANLMAIPLIIGIGIDSGLHVMHRTLQGTPPARVAETAGRAVTISSLTTMASFGSMILADHRGMQSLGETLLVGMAACLVLSVVALPAVLQLVHRPGAPD